MPDAFAIVRETARRFSQNEEITVTATDFDRELAATHDFVRIDGDKAISESLDCRRKRNNLEYGSLRRTVVRRRGTTPR